MDLLAEVYYNLAVWDSLTKCLANTFTFYILMTHDPPKEESRIWDVLHVVLQEVGQMAVQGTCHLQYEQKIKM